MGLGHQLGELFLGAVPTVLILIVLYFILKSLFFKPLLAVMAEREKRTAGAQRAAETAQAAAAEKVKQYQEALKQARAKVYAEQEAARKKLLDERAALVRASRNLASAAEEANSATEHATELFKWINFGILAAVLVWVFAAKLPTVFRANAETIASAITKATAVKAEADKQLAEAEAKLARLEEEIAL